MSSHSSLGVAVVTGGVSLAGALVWGARWGKLRSRRADLDRQYADSLAETSALDEARLAGAELLRQKRKESVLLHEAMDSIWKDRFERYKQTNKETHSYLRALPEALGVLKGVTNHYQYMAREMRKFIGFDVACSKVHNFALLLNHGEKVGIQRVSETIRQLLVAEPLVRVVCDSLLDEATNFSCPTSISESSDSFVFCMEGLDRAVDAAAARYIELQKPSMGESPPNVFCRVLRKITTALEANMLSRCDIIMKEERQALRNHLLRDRRQLHTMHDLVGAMRYVEELSRHFQDSAKNPASVNMSVLSDPEVLLAREQLLLWRRAAAIFLVRQQAKEALNSYHLLLAETLTKTRHPS
ncbi:uncharacterized protein TEOVI_000058300 [Trypanosoma equiperdum]|uniref:Uncharacterized protein n=2 Tax=Trypanozoon TaxID=39700 RepID=Q57YH2_TRYB2|nr:hypothetical protein, conserved [Trypanosoma brucei brucei TREU927]AAX69346.1 hypothetical protein, conserved [Trypanosoma brucei]AAZ12829.1 hypothetical protein, conserved [Trypanosoma brucei brucei TREU927]SCU68937.1 hypothetical protein, conserved [Trypanosoma equiperdum]